MKYFRVLISIIVGLVVISAITEGIEFSLVTMKSGMSFEELKNNQDTYFDIRNAPQILTAKLLYTFIAAIIAGYLTATIAGQLARLAIILLSAIQITSLIWGGFSSQWATTAPVWLWLALIVIVPGGLYFGYSFRVSKKLGP